MGQLKSKGVFLMNKYLMMSAAAVLASTGANAGTHSFTFGTAGGGSYCDGGTANTGGGVGAWQHTNNNCASGLSTGQGLLGKMVALGSKGYDMSDNYFGSAKSIALNYTLPKKIQNGGKWTLWIEFSGVSSFLGNSGVLVNVTPGKHGITSKAKTSTITKVQALVRSHKQS